MGLGQIRFLNKLDDASIVNRTLLELLLLIQRQVQFSTIFVLRNNVSTNELPEEVELLKSLDLPVIQLTTSKRYQLKRLFSDDILAMIFLTESSYQDVLNGLADNLHHIAQTKMIFVCTGMKHILMELFHLCWKKKMINAIAFLEETYYSYKPFPQIQLNVYSVHENRVVFPNQLLNLHRYPLRIVLDHIEPRNYIYTNRKGEELIGGYTGHLIISFAEKLNATIVKPFDNRNNVSHHTFYDAMLASDAVDIFAGLAYQIPTTSGYSDPAEVIGYCLMVPVEPYLPQYLYYPMILGSLPILCMFGMVFVFSFTINCFLWIERMSKLSLWGMFVKEDCIRTLLSQSFKEYQRASMKLRLIYFLSCIMGLFFNTWYLATLNTLVTSPPSERRVSSFEDLKRSSFKVLMFRPEYDDIRNSTDEFEKYQDSFELTLDNTWYHATRNSLNRSYAYPVPTNKWKMFEEQQSLYEVPIFRNTELCIVPVSLMVFLLNENSIFTRDLNQMIARTHESGLYGHWVRTSLLELIEGGRIKLNSQSGGGPKPLRLEDMKWLWGLFAVLVAVDCSSLIVEVIYKRIWWSESAATDHGGPRPSFS